MSRFWLIALAASLFILAILAACSPQEMAEIFESEADSEANTTEQEPVTAEEAAPIAYNGPAWTQLELTNARTGENFTLADFAGKAVYVEPMATWCTNCRAQLNRVREAQPQLDPEQVVIVAISVENGLSDARLADYAQRNGYDFVFTVGTTEFLTALVDQFGRTIMTPPATPHFTIAPDGTLSALGTGPESVDGIVNRINSLLPS